jgi:hypothetical protein
LGGILSREILGDAPALLPMCDLHRPKIALERGPLLICFNLRRRVVVSPVEPLRESAVAFDGRLRAQGDQLISFRIRFSGEGPFSWVFRSLQDEGVSASGFFEVPLNLFCFTLGHSENFGYFVVNGVFLSGYAPSTMLDVGFSFVFSAGFTRKFSIPLPSKPCKLLMLFVNQKIIFDESRIKP